MPAKFDRCVEEVQRTAKPGTNPYAVCRATLGTDAEIRASERRQTRRAPRSRARR